MNESIRMNQQDKETMSLAMSTSEPSGVKMTGHITDRIYKNGVLVEERVGHNLVVNTFLNLVMCLLKQQNGYSGVQYWAIGSGNPEWDSYATPPTPAITETRLTDELGRVAIPITDISFLDSGYNKVSTPTNIIQISHVFGTDECNGVWREFGIYGGNATEALNSGILINRRNHEVITKTSDMTIERIMRFTLSLV